MKMEGGFKAGERRFALDSAFCFLEDFQTILYHKFDGPLREVVHLFSADAEEGLPAELLETH